MERAKELERKLRRATFNLDDFLEQLQQVNRMGPISQVLEMIPGFSSISKRMSPEELDGKHMKTMEAIVYSMTPRERRSPEILNGSRRRRIAKGSGTIAPTGEPAAEPVPADAEGDEAGVVGQGTPEHEAACSARLRVDQLRRSRPGWHLRQKLVSLRLAPMVVMGPSASRAGAAAPTVHCQKVPHLHVCLVAHAFSQRGYGVIQHGLGWPRGGVQSRRPTGQSAS